MLLRAETEIPEAVRGISPGAESSGGEGGIGVPSWERRGEA